MDLSTLYWILILPNIKDLLLLLSFFGGLAILIMILFGVTGDEKEAVSWGVKKIKFLIPIVLIATLIPSDRQIMYIIGGYSATNIENVEQLPKNILNAANKFLEKYTEQKD